MTINKAQGQTFHVAGVDLSVSCFSHGQLYVALSLVSLLVCLSQLLESQEDLTETDLEKMLNLQSIQKEPSTNTENVTFNLKNLCRGLRMANEFGDFFMKIEKSMERSLIFKRQIAATAEYQSELKLLKNAKQEKITNFFKPLSKPEDNM